MLVRLRVRLLKNYMWTCRRQTRTQPHWLPLPPSEVASDDCGSFLAVWQHFRPLAGFSWAWCLHLLQHLLASCQVGASLLAWPALFSSFQSQAKDIHKQMNSLWVHLCTKGVSTGVEYSISKDKVVILEYVQNPMHDSWLPSMPFMIPAVLYHDMFVIEMHQRINCPNLWVLALHW